MSGLTLLRKALWRQFRENMHGIDGLQRGQNRSPVFRAVQRPACAFQCAHSVVVGHSDQQRVALRAGVFEIRHMAQMQQVKATIRHHQFFPSAPQFVAPARQIRSR